MQALRALDPDDPALDEEAFGPWLARHGASARAIAALWNLIALPTLNLPAQDASLALAAMVFRTGLLDESDACDLAIPAIPLQQLHGDPAATALRAGGATIRLRARVRRVRPDGEELSLELASGSERFDRVVVAVPHGAAPDLLPEGVLEPGATAGLGESPIVNVHLHYDRRVLGDPFAAAVDSPVQFVFDRTAPAGVERGQVRRDLDLACHP